MVHFHSPLPSLAGTEVKRTLEKKSQHMNLRFQKYMCTYMARYKASKALLRYEVVKYT